MIGKFRMVAKNLTKLLIQLDALFTSAPLADLVLCGSRSAHRPQNTPSSFVLYTSHGYYESQLTLNFQLHPNAHLLGKV